MVLHFPNRHRPPAPQRGFTLLEILVAMLILSVGLLGLANLQILGLRSNQGAFLRSQATVLAEEMAEKMRSNINRRMVFTDAGGDGDNDNDDAYTMAGPYANNSGDADSRRVNCNTLPVPYCASRQGTPAAACTPAQMAQFEFFTLSCGIGGGVAGGVSTLPNGRAFITCNDADAVALSANPVDLCNVSSPEPPGHADGRCIDGSSHTLTICWDEIDTVTGTTGPTALRYTFVP